MMRKGIGGTAADVERRKQQRREWQREWQRHAARRERERLADLARPTLYGLLDAADAAELERRLAKRPA